MFADRHFGLCIHALHTLVLALLNFLTIFALCQGVQSEYAVGVLVAMMVGQNLIASALGLASGLTEALLTLGCLLSVKRCTKLSDV